MGEQPASGHDPATSLSQERTDLALLRTRLAAERTLDAWVRTALSMISFGFTIYRFLEQVEKAQGAHPLRPHAARNFGMSLVLVGTLAVVAAIFQHVGFFKRLGLHPFRRPVSISVIVAAFVAILGALTILSLVAHIGPL